MSCKQGGLVLLRHNDVAGEWAELNSSALTPSAVSYEPLINFGRTAGERAAEAEGPTPPPGEDAAWEEAHGREDRGDVGVHGFWKRGATTIFDIRITDTDAPTYRGMDPTKVLARHEKEKKDKYLEACLERRRHFTPLVFSVDGLAGEEAKAAAKRAASHLSRKWKRAYSELCGYVRSRLALALVRATSLLLRGARDGQARIRRPAWDSGAGLALYPIWHG